MPTIWHYLFLFSAYVSGLACVVFAFTFMAEGLGKVLREVLVLLLFVIAYWLLESYTTHVSDYYHYPGGFWDLVPKFSGWHWFPFLPLPVAPHPACDHTISNGGISLSVLLLEASLTYTMMWTARVLAPKNLHYLWPLMTGLAMLCFILTLDAVVSESADCFSPYIVQDAGLEFWQWYAHPDLGTWLHYIPFFNWIAWMAAPMALVALILLLRWARNFLTYLQGDTSLAATVNMLLDGILRAVLALAFFLLFVIAPVRPLDDPLAEALIVVGIVLGAVIAIWIYRKKYRHDNKLRRYWLLLVPQFLFYAIALLILVFAGLHPTFPFLLAALVLTTGGVLYAISPYWRS